MLDYLFYASLPFALVGLIAYGVFGSNGNERIFRVAAMCSVVSFALLSGALILLVIQQGTQLVANSVARYVLAAWFSMLVNLIAVHRFGVRLLGAIVMPVSFLLLLHAVFTAQDPIPTLAHVQGLPVYLHIIFVFLGLALVLVAFGAAMLRIWKARNLKGHRLDDRLPSLATLDRQMAVAFDGGFLLLTLGVLLGFASGWMWDAKVVTAAMIWAVYAGVFVAHHLGQLGFGGLARSVVALFLGISLSFVFAGHSDQQGQQEMPAEQSEAP
ncbi:MAG TPA: hypothetical protein DCR55_12065 [Lentisphaeria bacterium]|jgi:ABC-type uncharacterized transport system permease subunit|nr:hypothetical protein [Lentisphaeria bacterium]